MPGAVLTESASGGFFLRGSVLPAAIRAYTGDRDTAAWERLRELLHL